jgi:murein endopeptidase
MPHWGTSLALIAMTAGAIAVAASRPWSETDSSAGSQAPTTVRAGDIPERQGDPQPREGPRRRDDTRPPPIEWRDSSVIGLPHAGSLEAGVRLPREGAHFFTWDPIRERRPNRPWRRWGTDDLVRAALGVIRDYAAANPHAPRVAVGDLSRRHGGDFGPRFGRPGHVSHQNGLDVDLYYPRRDGREVAPESVSQIDIRLAQDLVDRFVEAGAEKVFVGPNTGLTGPADVVVPLTNHDNHVHVRLPG